MNDRPVIDCVYGYQRENQEETVCRQQGGSDEEVEEGTFQEKHREEEGSSEKDRGENESRC